MDCYNDLEFQDKFRLDKSTFSFLLNEVREDFENATSRNSAIPPCLQLCFALRYFASSYFFTLNGDTGIHGVSKAAVSRTIQKWQMRFQEKGRWR